MRLKSHTPELLGLWVRHSLLYLKRQMSSYAVTQWQLLNEWRHSSSPTIAHVRCSFPPRLAARQAWHLEQRLVTLSLRIQTRMGRGEPANTWPCGAILKFLTHCLQLRSLFPPSHTHLICRFLSLLFCFQLLPSQPRSSSVWEAKIMSITNMSGSS